MKRIPFLAALPFQNSSPEVKRRMVHFTFTIGDYGRENLCFTPTDPVTAKSVSYIRYLYLYVRLWRSFSAAMRNVVARICAVDSIHPPHRRRHRLPIRDTNRPPMRMGIIRAEASLYYCRPTSFLFWTRPSTTFSQPKMKRPTPFYRQDYPNADATILCEMCLFALSPVGPTTRRTMCIFFCTHPCVFDNALRHKTFFTRFADFLKRPTGNNVLVEALRNGKLMPS